MALQAGGKIAFFFEEAPCYGDDQGKGYCMVYVPLTIEAITKNVYTTPQANIVSTIGEYKMGTFYANEAMMIPSGINAYVATESPVMIDGEGYITMTEITKVIPAQTGVVICGEPGTYTFEPAETEGESVAGNMLRGYAGVFEYESVVLPTDATIYVLAVEDDKVGFYRKESNFKVYNNKAYLQVPNRSNVRSLYFNFNGNMTGIETLQGNDQPATIYDLQGRRLTNSNAKGFYIINGNKVIIK
jgi:hypothetical protein